MCSQCIFHWDGIVSLPVRGRSSISFEYLNRRKISFSTGRNRPRGSDLPNNLLGGTCWAFHLQFLCRPEMNNWKNDIILKDLLTKPEVQKWVWRKRPKWKMKVSKVGKKCERKKLNLNRKIVWKMGQKKVKSKSAKVGVLRLSASISIAAPSNITPERGRSPRRVVFEFLTNM